MGKTMLDVINDKQSKAKQHIFGPDYYARQASSPQGQRNKSSENQELAWPRQTSESNENDGETKHKIIIETVPYGTTKVEVDSSEIKQAQREEIIPTLKTQVALIEGPQEAVSELTSDSDVSYVNCYDVTNSQVYKKTKNGEKEVNGTENNLNGTDEERIEIVKREVPVFKERKYIKSQPMYSSPLKTSNQTKLRRYKSETDLLEDSFDTPPKVLARKKDNTLISRIYSQPHVRQFALSSRNQVPVEDAPTTPVFTTQRSLNETAFRYNGKVPIYYSDDGASLNRNSRSSFYSSTEDILENGSSKAEVTRPKTSATERSYETRSQTISMSSEDDIFSEHSSTAEQPIKKTNSKTNLYSSSDDLLSIEEIERPHRKKDNTIIGKIYQNPNVRSFAMSSREYIPGKDDSNIRKKTYNTEDKPKRQIPSPLPVNSSISVDSQKSQDTIVSQYNQSLEAITIELEKPEAFLAICAPYFPDEENNNSPIHHEHLDKPARNIASPDPEINEIAKKKIVHNILEQYSVNNSEVSLNRRANGEVREINNNEEEINVSVRELRKKFENNNGKNIVISSLTARSLSKQIREDLKK